MWDPLLDCSIFSLNDALCFLKIVAEQKRKVFLPLCDDLVTLNKEVTPMMNCFNERTAPDASLVGTLEFYNRAIRKKRSLSVSSPRCEATVHPGSELLLPSIIVDDHYPADIDRRSGANLQRKSFEYTVATLLFAAGAVALTAMARFFGYL